MKRQKGIGHNLKKSRAIGRDKNQLEPSRFKMAEGLTSCGQPQNSHATHGCAV